MHMAFYVSLPAVAVLCAFVTTDMDPLAPILVSLMCVGLIAILWRRHGRIVFVGNTVKMYNGGLSQTLKREDVAGYVWRAPQNFMPYGDGIVFVAEDQDNGIGLRTRSPMASASYLLHPRQEVALVALIEEWDPAITYYETPTKWRSRSPLVQKRKGGVEPPSVATQR